MRAGFRKLIITTFEGASANVLFDIASGVLSDQRIILAGWGSMTEQDTSFRGARPSIVESFKIEGLYGYRTISIASEYSATILIAKNGSGKTTILAALDAFLRCQFSRLRDLKFFRITCKLRAVNHEITLSRDDLATYLRNDEVELGARRLEVEPAALFGFVEEYASDDRKLNYDDDVGQRILQKFNTRAEAQSFCAKLKDGVTSRVPSIEVAADLITTALKGTDIVYLPTYRRIELSIAPNPRSDRYGRRQRPVLPGLKSGLFSTEIQFGLSDILERLSELNQRIVFDSNLGYREISASIIKELIDGSFDQVAATPDDIPHKDELELFFSRLREGRRGYGPYIDQISIPNMDKIYTGQDISDERNKFLRYFLAKLNTVIKTTSDIEAIVRDFIGGCNRYLSSVDPSTSLSRDTQASLSEIDHKELRLDRRDLKVSVQSLTTGRTIPLDSLSSGEKQMISLFAKLFLYPKNHKIVLIDEPELSLSLEWQRQILLDVINAPLCSQIVAITHSPFIFDNALDPFARSLVSSIDPRRGAIPDDSGDDA
jgi:predicted ATPase